jgi:hypothetical protein
MKWVALQNDTVGIPCKVCLEIQGEGKSSATFNCVWVVRPLDELHFQFQIVQTHKKAPGTHISATSSKMIIVKKSFR